MNDFSICIHEWLLNSNIFVVWIFYLKSETASVPELIHCEAWKPFLVVFFKHFTEFFEHWCLIVRSCYITVWVKLGQYHRLFNSVIYICVSLIAVLCKLIYLAYCMACKCCTAFFCNIIWPAPMKCHVSVYGYNICCPWSFCKYVFHLHLFVFKFLTSVKTDDSLNIWSFFSDYLTCMFEECCNFLITCSLVEWEPVSCCFMIYTKLNPTECSKVFCDCHKMLVWYLRVDSHCKEYILSMSSYISHAGKRLII